MLTKDEIGNHGAGASSRFLYRTVAEALRERVRTNVYRPGSRIPSFSELATEFKVSQITIRRAISDLSVEGRLVGRQGLGVFVAHERRIVRSLSMDNIEPIEEEMRASGVRGSLHHVGIAIVAPASEPFLGSLGQGETSLLRLNRILLADNEPVGLDNLWITHALADKLDTNLEGKFVMSLLGKRGIIVDQINYHVEATTASQTEASALGVVTGFPLLVVRFFPVDSTGKPILVGQTVTRADRFMYQFAARPKLSEDEKRGS